MKLESYEIIKDIPICSICGTKKTFQITEIHKLVYDKDKDETKMECDGYWFCANSENTKEIRP